MVTTGADPKLPALRPKRKTPISPPNTDGLPHVEGRNGALVALGHTILTIVYTLMTRWQPYQDLGATYFDQREQHRVEQRLVQRLERLGYEVASQPKALQPVDTTIFSRVSGHFFVPL